MPAEWYSEAIVVAAKGPGIGSIMRAAHYEKGANDTVKWLPDPHEPTEIFFNLLPDWWC